MKSETSSENFSPLKNIGKIYINNTNNFLLPKSIVIRDSFCNFWK